MPTEVIVGLFALGGVALGFAGQWLLEERRDARAGRTAVAAVFFEMSLLGAALESAAKDEEMTRGEIKAPMWDRHSPELINHMPQAFVSVLQLQYDQLPKVANAYAQCTAGVTQDRWKPLTLMMVAWAYRADRLRELQNEWRRRRRLFWRRGAIEKSEDASQVWDKVESDSALRTQIEMIRSDVQAYAVRRLRSDGFEVDDDGKMKAVTESEAK